MDSFSGLVGAGFVLIGVVHGNHETQAELGNSILKTKQSQMS